MTIVIHRLAQAEVRMAFRWYRRRSYAAAARWLAAFDAALDQVVANPTAWPVMGSDFRYIKLGRFPYSLIYVIQEGKLLIVALAHASRRPFYWRRRK